MLPAGVLIILGCGWLTAGSALGWLYLFVFALAIAPGLPIGWRLFGRNHAAGWIAGALIGYPLVSLVIWLAYACGSYSTVAAVAGWLLLCVAAALLRGQNTPLIPLGDWSRRDAGPLVCVAALAAVLTTIPLHRIGERADDGSRQYRAYFTADFLWHTALTAELTAGVLPPRNPYLAPQPIHYYWTYFLLPASVARSGPAPLRDVEQALKMNALGTGMLFLSAVFMAAMAASRHAWAAATATMLAVLASSAEGLYELWRISVRGLPWSALHGINVDALTAWYFQGHRIDGLQRCLWYVPQHSMAYALGLIAITAAAARDTRPTGAAIMIVGVALGGAVMMNPFVGGVFALAWGITIGLRAVRGTAPVQTISRHLLAAVPVAAAIAWCVSNRMVEGAGGNLAVGWADASRHFPIWNLMLSLGPSMLPALMLVALRPSAEYRRSLLPATGVAVIALIIMHTVWLTVDAAWAPFRAGQMFLAVVPGFTAVLIAVTAGRPVRRFALIVLALAFATGIGTTVIDTFNAQDVRERGSGAGFHWTLVVSRQEQAALDWIKAHTPRTAIVQMEPTIRDRDLSPGGWGEYWSLIPSFGQRRMSAGLPISLMRVPAYAERSDKVRVIFQSADAMEAWQAARDLRIDYLYVDGHDRAVYPACGKFDNAPDQFEPVFRLDDVGVYRVK